MLPVLHLNGYKINNPTILARISHEELEALFVGYGYTPYFVEGTDPQSMHQAMAATLEHCVAGDPQDPGGGRQTGTARRPRWPMIVLRSPKGWTAPREVDGHHLEGFWRAHQVPMADVRDEPRASEGPGAVDAQLQAGRALRRSRPADPRAASPAAQGDAGG